MWNLLCFCFFLQRRSKTSTKGLQVPSIIPPIAPDDLVSNGMQVHTTTRFTCRYCQKIFSSGDFLKDHIKSAHGAPRYSCGGCGEQFKWRNSRRRHYTKCIAYIALNAASLADGGGSQQQIDLDEEYQNERQSDGGDIQIPENPNLNWRWNQ